MHDVAIIGAGPYGLSIASHLGQAGLDYRIFGSPMQTWRTQMPAGMRLKSEGFASNLYDPGGTYRLVRHCAERGVDYADTGLPVRLDLFIEYGMTFQKQFVPSLEECRVVSLASGGGNGSGGGFTVGLDDGRTASFRKVVVAAGISHYDYVPEVLATLPASLLSHSSLVNEPAAFAGRSVLVIGGGASAADCAALLAEAGAQVQLATRRTQLRFHAPPKPRSTLDKIRWPMTTVGPGWKSVLCTQAPLVFHAMPEDFRLDVTRRYLGPAPCWFVRDRIEQDVRVHAGVTVAEAREEGGRAVVELDGPDGRSTVTVDHVVAATGYRVDLDRLAFLTPPLSESIRAVARTPVLSTHFESSVPGLFFVGAASANSFGPLVRFACGAEFTAKRLTRGLLH